MAQNRKQERKPNRFITKVYDCSTDEYMGRLANISTGGMMLITNHGYEREDRFQVKIGLPVPVNNLTDIQIEAEVRWCKKDSNPEFFAVGFKFSKLTREDIQVIETVFGNISLVG